MAGARPAAVLIWLIWALALLPVAAGSSAAKDKPLETVPHVELARYVGTRYEIASFPQRFQKGCTGTVATYSIRPDGAIDVLNRCARDSLAGKVTTAKGRARIVDATTNAKLEVSFLWPFWGDYVWPPAEFGSPPAKRKGGSSLPPLPPRCLRHVDTRRVHADPAADHVVPAQQQCTGSQAVKPDAGWGSCCGDIDGRRVGPLKQDLQPHRTIYIGPPWHEQGAPRSPRQKRSKQAQGQRGAHVA